MPTYVNSNQTESPEKQASKQALLGISQFNNEKDNTPRNGEITWANLCEGLSKHAERSTKQGGAVWSPVSYKPGTVRGNRGVENVYLAVLDIDNGTPVEAVKAKLVGLAAIIHSSFSHTPELPKYRVVLPLTKSVPASQWPDAWARIRSFFGNINDPSTKDASRLYYLPAKAPGSVGHFAEVFEGAWLDLDSLPELAEEKATSSGPNRVAVASNDDHSYAHVEGIEELPRELSPRKGLDDVVARCKFMQAAANVNYQPDVPEPLWMAMITNACVFEDSEEWIHEASSVHPSYSKKATDERIARYRQKNRPITCKYIQELGFEGCPKGGCALPSEIATKAPAGLHVWSFKKSQKRDDGFYDDSDFVYGGDEALPRLNMPDDLAYFLNSYMPLRYVNGGFQGYTEGYWPKLDDMADVKNAIAIHLGMNASTKKINDIFTLAAAFKAEHEMEGQENKALICLRNGTLDTQAYTLLEHSQDHRLTTKTNIEWNPEAECPRWLQFLEEIFAFDNDNMEKINFVQEWFGYCLVPDNSHHKFVWMVGGGGNGKSVLLTALTKLVGEANTSHAYIERLDNKFVRAELEGKLVNISPEMSAEATVSDGYLKAIVSGDIIEAERKFKPSFSFRPYVRLIAATNNMPRLLDLTDGFFRRAIVLSFNRKFTGTECDPKLEEKLTQELPGILVWAVEGLRKLRERGHFIVPQSSQAMLSEYRTESDPIRLFATDSLEKVATKGALARDIYAGYCAWCKENNFSPKTSVNFGKHLAELGYEKYRSNGNAAWRVSFKVEGLNHWDRSIKVELPKPIIDIHTIDPEELKEMAMRAW